ERRRPVEDHVAAEQVEEGLVEAAARQRLQQLDQPHQRVAGVQPIDQVGDGDAGAERGQAGAGDGGEPGGTDQGGQHGAGGDGAGDQQVRQGDGVAGPGGQHRGQHGERREADQGHAGGGEAGQQEARVDAAVELEQAQHRQPGQQEDQKLGGAGGQLAQDDLPAAQVGGQHELQGAPLLLVGDGAADVAGREQQHGDELDADEDDEQDVGQLGLAVQRRPGGAAGGLGGQDEDEERAQGGGVGDAEEEDAALPAGADHLVGEDGSEQPQPAAAQQGGEQHHPDGGEGGLLGQAERAAQRPAEGGGEDEGGDAGALAPGLGGVGPGGLAAEPGERGGGELAHAANPFRGARSVAVSPLY